MEKIQDAIAKARAARVADPRAAADAPRRAAPAARGDAAVAAAWAGLSEFVPVPAHLRRQRIMTRIGGPEAKDFDVLRTRILQQMRANGWRRLAVTSPGPACGKSTLVLNLAFSLARQSDQRTIVAEMDMRRPSLAPTLGLRSKQTFDAVLRGDAPFEDHAVRTDTNLAFTTHERPVRAAAELLQSESTARVLDDIQARFAPTVMLFDLPPVLASDDAMAFLGRVDCVILLAAAEQTSIKQIDACERDIASQTNVMGVVLNKCRYLEPEQEYGY